GHALAKAVVALHVKQRKATGWLMRSVDVRRPAVAGFFYPADPRVLAQEVERLLAEAAAAPEPPPRAIIAPHAGYIYSGPVAASAYVRLRAARDAVRRVVLLGPAHRVWLRGLALPGAQHFETPLGRVRLDVQAIEAI